MRHTFAMKFTGVDDVMCSITVDLEKVKGAGHVRLNWSRKLIPLDVAMIIDDVMEWHDDVFQQISDMTGKSLIIAAQVVPGMYLGPNTYFPRPQNQQKEKKSECSNKSKTESGGRACGEQAEADT